MLAMGRCETWDMTVWTYEPYESDATPIGSSAGSTLAQYQVSRTVTTVSVSAKTPSFLDICKRKQHFNQQAVPHRQQTTQQLCSRCSHHGTTTVKKKQTEWPLVPSPTKPSARSGKETTYTCPKKQLACLTTSSFCSRAWFINIRIRHCYRLTMW